MDDITSIDDSKSNKKSSLNVFQYDAKVALAFLTDCENLLQTFKDRQKLNFCAFSELWKEQKIISVYHHQENLLGIQAFLESSFNIIKKLFASPDPYIQTGALYILYGLYYKQPVKKWVKIRLTHSDLTSLDALVESHKTSGSLEPVFIYNKMRIDGAFEYCALNQRLGLNARHLRRVDVSSEELNAKKAKTSVLDKFKKLIEDDPDLAEFEETDDEYQKLAGKYKEKLFVFPSKISAEFKKIYSDNFQSNSDDKEEQSVRGVKRRAMSNNEAIYRGEKKIITALDLAGCSTSK